MNALSRLLENRAGTRLEIDQETDLALRLAGGLKNRAATGHVHGHRLGQIDVLASFNGSERVLGMIVGRSLYDHAVKLGIRKFTIRIRSIVDLGTVDTQLVARLVKILANHVSNRHNACGCLVVEKR